VRHHGRCARPCSAPRACPATVKRVTEAMLKMVKLDIAALEAAAQG